MNKQKETVEKILALLDGFEYKDARVVLRMADDELSGYADALAESVAEKFSTALGKVTESLHLADVIPRAMLDDNSPKGKPNTL